MNGTDQQSPYSELQGKTETRLLRLEAGKFDDPVRCEIHHVSSPQDALYIAVSYTWGNPKDTIAIQLNGKEHQVTRNLASFLRHMQAIANAVLEWARPHFSTDEEDQTPQVMLQTAVCNIIADKRFTGILERPELHKFSG